MDVDHAQRAAAALKTATEHDGAKGALAGVAGVTGTIVLALDTAGLTLTAPGLLVAAAIGGIAGGLGLIKKARNYFVH